MKKTILTVDDEINILELLKFNLENEGYEVLQSENGVNALKILDCKKVDGVILDQMLPGMQGLDVLKKIRENTFTKKIPVLILTAKTEEFDKVLGFELGADDYLSKPFSVRELMARIKALLRRVESISEADENLQQNIISFQNIQINEYNRTVLKENKTVELTLKEFELLKLFAKNPDKVFTRNELLEKIWGYDYEGETRTVDVHIGQLRKKVEDDENNPFFIKTIRGIGYKLSED